MSIVDGTMQLKILPETIYGDMPECASTAPCFYCAIQSNSWNKCPDQRGLRLHKLLNLILFGLLEQMPRSEGIETSQQGHIEK